MECAVLATLLWERFIYIEGSSLKIYQAGPWDGGINLVWKGKPEKQKEAELRHRELALEAGGSNDFVTLLNVFEKCRARSVGKTFHTMDGHGSAVHIHPSSILFDQESQLDWVIFHDVIVTSKIYVRTLCPVRYEWVKDLLPKLHEVDVYQLSSIAKDEVAGSTTQQREALNKTKKQS
eukprot:g41719.t1